MARVGSSPEPHIIVENYEGPTDYLRKSFHTRAHTPKINRLGSRDDEGKRFPISVLTHLREKVPILNIVEGK